MPNLKIAERQNGFITSLDLEGKIALGDGCSELNETLRLLVERGERKILLNMLNVTYIDSSGLGELVSAFKALEKNAGQMKLLQLSNRTHEMITLTKLLTVFDIYENEEEAVESFHSSYEKIGFLEPATVIETLNKAAFQDVQPDSLKSNKRRF